METLVNTAQANTLLDAKKSVEQLHQEAMLWNSKLKFVFFELNFAKNLINSYAFEPRTANSFLLLQEFKVQTDTLSHDNPLLQEQIKIHENELGGLEESVLVDSSIKQQLKSTHLHLETVVKKHIKCFETLKVEIFNYCEHILHQNKKS